MAKLGERAVVLGASMGGLLAARVLADYFSNVTVVDRDVLPSDPANRRGVPQGRHVHALLRRGGQILDELFTGFLAELVADGAPVLGDGDFSTLWAEFGGHLMVRSGKARNVDDLGLYLASRPFLECHVLRRVTAIANVTILDGQDVAGLTSTPDRDRVTGVRVVERDRREEKVLSADLVVDAMGRGAHTPAFLESIGYGRPIEDHVVMHTTYASQLLRVPSGAVERMVLVSAAPGRPKGMFLFGYENDTWMFTVFGMVGCEPPGSRDGMLDFARDYAPAHVLSAVRAAEPLGEVIRHRMPSSQWRRYDKMRRFPEGLLVFGDAICSFNPVYGQGMTVSALEAEALRDCLRVGSHDLARRFFRAASKSIRVAWQIAAGGDLAFPEVEGRRSLSMRVSNRCADWILSACESDTLTTERFFRVNNFVDPPARLFHPAFIYRVAAVNLRRRQRDSQPRPAEAAGRSDSRMS
jgi:2-polyprenyl-6-methoxyphenol hydroxylase-like FAD-dependent oxidoreductase